MYYNGMDDWLGTEDLLSQAEEDRIYTKVCPALPPLTHEDVS